MNPFVEKATEFFGKNPNLLGTINMRRRKPLSYSKMKIKQIKKRRAKNKLARKSRRINRIRKEA